MQVIVRDRQQGKTTELIKWLLQGRPQDGYPGWSRVIVCPTHSQVILVDHMLKRYIQDNAWTPCDRMKPHFHTTEHTGKHFDIIVDVRKAVWGLKDYAVNARNGRSFEFAVDNLDTCLQEGARFLRTPDLVTMTGELYTGDCLRD